MEENQGACRAMIWRAIELLFSHGVMQASGHGNISARLGEDRMFLTSRGGLKTLTPDDFAVVSFDGLALEGKLEPETAEVVAMHAAVYRTRQEAGAVIHTHSPHATAFALAHSPLPCAYEALLRWGIDQAIPVAEWAPRGSQDSASNVVQLLNRHPNIPAVLLANHGVLAFASTPLKAADLIIAIEEVAQVTILARMLGGEKAFPANALKRVRERMERFKERNSKE